MGCFNQLYYAIDNARSNIALRASDFVLEEGDTLDAYPRDLLQMD